MEKILEIIIKYLEEGNYKIATIIIGLLLPVAIVWKSKDFLEYWSNRQNFRRRLLEEIINKIQKTEIKNFLEGEFN